MSDLIERQAAIDVERNATVDTNPSHFEAHQKFTQFMDDAEISSFGRWQWSNGFNTALTAVGIDLKKLPSAQPEPLPTASQWHRVEEELPPNAKHPGAFCKKYQVMTKWGVTEGWFNPDVGEDGLWDILVWFFMGHYDDVNDIDFERGDKPKLMWVTKDYVSAWMEKPEPPQSDER